MSILGFQLVLLPPCGHLLKLLLSKHMSCLVEQLTPWLVDLPDYGKFYNYWKQKS